MCSGIAVAGVEHRPALPQPPAAQQELRRLRLPGRGEGKNRQGRKGGGANE